MSKVSPATSRSSRKIVKGGPRFDTLSVQMPMLPNFVQISGDEKHWMTMPVSQIHPKMLRRIGRAWTELLVAKSKVKVKK